MSAREFEFGLDTPAFVTVDESGQPLDGDVVIRNTIGSHALLLQMATNLVHNAIVHNLPEHGTVWVTTSAHPKGVELSVENTGEKLTPQLVATLPEPFQRGTERIRTDHTGVGLGWPSSSASPKHTTEPSPSGALAGSASRCNYPPRNQTPADDAQGNCHTSSRRRWALGDGRLSGPQSSAVTIQHRRENECWSYAPHRRGPARRQTIGRRVCSRWASSSRRRR
jgi:hypothetical protein